MITENENETGKEIVKKPSPMDMARYIERSKASNGMVRGAFIGIQANGGRQFTNEKGETGYSFGVESVSTRLSDEDINRLLGLLDSAEPVMTKEQAAKELGLEVEEVERADALLRGITEDIQEGDYLEFITLNFEKEAFDRGEGDGKSISGGMGGTFEGKYLGRVRYDADDRLISVAMDAVPPVKNNAAYVLRNDEGYISDVHAALTSKKAIRDTESYRQILHNETTGMDGVKRRMTKALTMPYVDFLDREHIDL